MNDNGSVYYAQDRRTRGRLKIFLGMSAGVGKTYTMLEIAQKKQAEGVHLVVGAVDTHGRQETAKWLETLQVLPLKTMVYKGKEFKELDLEAILALKPQIVLVDELAHTNIPGSKHAKRWQDVLEILDNGIDVYATINIQHIESYKDIIEAITEIKIRETVPDLMLEQASEIEFIDITPAELLQRLKEGKVYTGDFSSVALQNFFQEDRLTALREIALRFTAEKVDQELHEMAFRGSRRWTPKEKLLVAINHELYAQHLIRITKRMSTHLHAHWIVLYVDQTEGLSQVDRALLDRNFALARELGAEVITTQDVDIAQGIERIAKQEGVTQIILGKSYRKKISHLFGYSLADRLSAIQEDINILIVGQPSHIAKKKSYIGKAKEGIPYIKIGALTVGLTLFNMLIVKYVGYKFVGSIYLLSLLIFSPFFTLGPLILSALLSFLLWAYFFVPEITKVDTNSLEDIGMMVLFFVAALIGRSVTHSIKKWQKLALKKERLTESIYLIAKEISTASTSAELLKGVKKKLGDILQGKCEIAIKKPEGGLNYQAAATIEKDEKEKAVALWVFENGQEAGWSTDTLSYSQFLYIPLKGVKKIVGVLAFRSKSGHALLPEENHFLYTIAQQLALFFERSFAEERELKSQFAQQIEKIYIKILQSIAHELSSPLKMIQHSLKAIKKEEKTVPVQKATDEIEKSAESLLRIVDNARSMAEFSKGGVTFRKSLHNVEEWINLCCREMEERFESHRLKIVVHKTLPLIEFDLSLMTILLRHLLYNAIQYSPPQTTITIEAELYDSTFVLSVSDEGKGIPEEQLDLIFEKFYRAEGEAASGLGLGLAIVKSIADIHNASIKVFNRMSGGTTFSFILPLQ